MSCREKLIHYLGVIQGHLSAFSSLVILFPLLLWDGFWSWGCGGCCDDFWLIGSNLHSRNSLRCLRFTLIGFHELFLYSVVFRVRVIRWVVRVHVDGSVALGVDDLPAHNYEAKRHKAHHGVHEDQHGIGDTPSVIGRVSVEVQFLWWDVAWAHFIYNLTIIFWYLWIF